MKKEATRSIFAFVTLAASTSLAAIPAAAKVDPLYAKGYLVVTYYPGVYNDGTHAASTTQGLNQALIDAYNADVPQGSLVAYFPTGTYAVNNTLKAWTHTGVGPSDPGYSFATPRNHLAMVGSTSGARRPIIKLSEDATGFDSPLNPKIVLDFRNFSPTNLTEESPSQGYHQMLRGIDIDCAGYAGAVALYFSQAQDSSIENVSINAQGGVAGLRGLPARGWGATNINIEGGRYGIDTVGTGNAGSTLVGVRLRNQTVSAIRHDQFVPLVVVGFEIETPSGSTQSAITIESGNGANGSGLHLIDGQIRLGAEPAIAAIDNRHGKNFYARNVYVTGGDRLVKSAGLPPVTSSGLWKRIAEYGYSDQSPPDNTNKISTTLIDGAISKKPVPLENGEVVSMIHDSAPPPDDLTIRHVWSDLPSIDNGDVFDPVEQGLITLVNGNANVSSSAFQDAIDNPKNKRIFLRKGIYHLDGTLTLRSHTQLFGAARFLTRIEVNSATWNPTSETPMITTNNDKFAATSLSDLTVGVDATNLANDWFVALDWRAGRRSVVAMGQVYREPAATVPLNRLATQPHSLIRIRNNGGGRWYFVGSKKAFTSGHPEFRILKVEKTSEPLSFYGLNLEHPGGCDAYGEFQESQNVRIYGVKSEFSGSAGLESESVLLKYVNTVNLAQFGSGALRNAISNRGCVEFVGNKTNRVLATLIAPQIDNGTAAGDTLRESMQSVVGVKYPDVVSIYKRGVISDADDLAVSHVFETYDAGVQEEADAGADEPDAGSEGLDPVDAGTEPKSENAALKGQCGCGSVDGFTFGAIFVVATGRWVKRRRTIHGLEKNPAMNPTCPLSANAPTSKPWIVSPRISMSQSNAKLRSPRSLMVGAEASVAP